MTAVYWLRKCMLFLQTLKRRQRRKHALFSNSSCVILPRPARPCKWTSHVSQIKLCITLASIVLCVNLTAVSPAGSSGLSLRPTSCLNWKKWWMTSGPRHPSKEVQRIPMWSPYRLKTWRRGSWRLWGDTMGRCPLAQLHCLPGYTSLHWKSRPGSTSPDFSCHT